MGQQQQPMYKYLVTGGLGYIGSHIVLSLIKQPTTLQVIIVDNEINSYEEKLDVIKTLAADKADRIIYYKSDLTELAEINKIMKIHKPNLVIHLAGLKSVAQSVEWALEYYNNNLLTTINLINAMSSNGIQNLIFSSSATVYSPSDSLSPFTEQSPTGNHLSNPYARSKFFQEEYLKDIQAAEPKWWNISILRYFNPIGTTHPSLQEKNKPLNVHAPARPNNLYPIVLQVADGTRPYLEVFGTDYPTPDGTAIRDYIHVQDLAEGHVAVAEKIHLNENYLINSGYHVFNLGTGRGTSVKEFVDTFNAVRGTHLPINAGNGVSQHLAAPAPLVPIRNTQRRPGDVAFSVADVSKAKNILGWEAKRSLEDCLIP